MPDTPFDRHSAELELVWVKLSQELRILRWLVAIGLVVCVMLGVEILIQLDARLPVKRVTYSEAKP